MISAPIINSTVIAKSDSDEAIHSAPLHDGLLRSARNDESTHLFLL